MNTDLSFRIDPVSTMILRTLLMVLLPCLLTACLRPAGVRDTDPRRSTGTPNTQTAPPASGLDSQRAGTGLRRQAAELTDAGDFQRASRLLQRALRVDSGDPATYYEFARLRLVEGNPTQARQLIEKGLSLRPDRALRLLFDQLKQQAVDSIDA